MSVCMFVLAFLKVSRAVNTVSVCMFVLAFLMVARAVNTMSVVVCMY